jgi:hypothetical protein
MCNPSWKKSINARTDFIKESVLSDVEELTFSCEGRDLRHIDRCSCQEEEEFLLSRDEENSAISLNSALHQLQPTLTMSDEAKKKLKWDVFRTERFIKQFPEFFTTSATG